MVTTVARDCLLLFAFCWDHPLLSFNVRAPGALGTLLVPHAAQQSHSPPAREDQKIAVGPVYYRLGLKAALGHAVFAVYLLRPRAGPQRCPDSVQIAKHGSHECLYPSYHMRLFARLPRATWLECRKGPAAPPTSPVASQPWLRARAPRFPCSQPARRRALRCAPPLSPAWAAAAVPGAGRAR